MDENLARRLLGNLIGGEGTAGIGARSNSAPAFAKIDQSVIRNLKPASRSGAGGFAALVGGTQSKGENLGKASNGILADASNISGALAALDGGTAGDQRSGGNREDDFDPSASNFHSYNTSNGIGGKNCAEEKVIDAFLRFAIPGRPPISPVRSGGKYDVYDPRLGSASPKFGRVRTSVSQGGRKIVNTTLPGHILRDGFIERNLKPNPGGGYRVWTYGEGENVYPGFNKVNEWQGREIFDFIDQQLAQYVAEQCTR